MRIFLALCLITLFFTGCTKREPAKEDPTHAAARRVVETAVGAGKVQHLKDTRNTITDINATQKERHKRIR